MKREIAVPLYYVVVVLLPITNTNNMIQPPLQAGPMAAASNTNASGYGALLYYLV